MAKKQRSVSALWNKEGAENTSTCGQSVIGFLLLISTSALLAVGGDTEEHVEVSRNQANGYGRKKKWESHTTIFCGRTSGSVGEPFRRRCRIMKEFIMTMTII